MVMGYVTDFLATTFVSFPVFNVADMFVTCGVVISFVIYTAWESRREHAAAKADVSSHEA
jgi:signal peptidase II